MSMPRGVMGVGLCRQQVTMMDRGAAERACKDANPIIDGRKANVNLAYLGAKPRSPQTGGSDTHTHTHVRACARTRTRMHTHIHTHVDVNPGTLQP